MAARLNLKEPDYDGFDPTGVCVVFAATAAAARILGLDETRTLNALALAFNRCGGSFQSNIDGSLAVRVIEGWVAETGVTCALLAARGVAAPGTSSKASTAISTSSPKTGSTGKGSRADSAARPARQDRLQEIPELRADPGVHGDGPFP